MSRTDRVDLTALLDIEQVAHIPADAVPELLGRIEILKTALLGRVAVAPRPSVAEEYLNYEDAARVLGVTPREVARLTREPGGLPRIPLGRKCIRIPRSALDVWMRSQLVAAPTSVYSSPNVGRGATADPEATRPDASRARRAHRRTREQRRTLGARRGSHHGAGRPLDSAPRQDGEALNGGVHGDDT